jgi:spermidine/putrescine transport system ATP-binding protein
LLLDEPLSALDYKLRKDMQIELKRLQHETGITFIFVTHDQEEALTMSDRIAVMSKGKILQVGSPHEIYDQPSVRFVANFIGETNFLEGVVAKKGRVKLDAGPEIDAAGLASSGKVTVVVRPEHASLTSPSKSQLKAGVKNIVYFGTDTHFHVSLADGTDFMVRQQNSGGSAASLKLGDKVGVLIAAGTARILQD